MKLADHVDGIRELIYKAFDKQFGRLGIGAKKTIEIEKLPTELHNKRNKLEEIIQNHIGETGTFENAREKALEEFTFTLFNRIAAIKVMEAHQLFPPIITKESIHGDRSFGHKAWLEENPSQRNEELEGLREYIKYAFNTLANDIALYSGSYPYALLPHPIELDEIINAFNAIQNDTQIESEIWKNDDILGWLYESYNNAKKQAFKDSKDKTEYDKVSLQSQVYTPKWVVEFLVNNSLGKLYLEMYPNSNIKNRYKIANAPSIKERDIKPLTEIKLIDPACGSGNFLLYAYDLFYQLYMDQIDNYGADYEEKDIPKLIIENNICGIDLDDRAIQLATLGLYIKAKQNRRTISNLKFNVISSDFFLPDFQEVKEIFETSNLTNEQQKLVEDIWDDLKYAYKFGSLVKVGEKIQAKVESIYEKVKREGQDLFNTVDIQDYYLFEQTFFKNLEIAVQKYASSNSNSFLVDKTSDAITFLKLVSQKYDVATANPPYTDSADFGKGLKKFIDDNYKKPYKFNSNLYATFIKRCYELTDEEGKIAMLHPLTFMYIKTFEDVRKFILDKTQITLLGELGLGGVFANSDVQADVVMYILSKNINEKNGIYFDLKKYKNHTSKPQIFEVIYNNYLEENQDNHTFELPQEKLKMIKSFPFIYWISDELRNMFKDLSLEKQAQVISGVKTGNNDGALRFWWEVDSEDWIPYAKGGPYNKWYGNIWLCVNWKNNAEYIQKQKSFSIIPDKYIFKKAITYSSSGSKKASFRVIEENNLFDMMGSGLLPKEEKLYNYFMGFLNSTFACYVLASLNPTAATQTGDVKRIPFKNPDNESYKIVSKLVEENIFIKKLLCTYSILENIYDKSPLAFSSANDLKQRILEYLNYENYLLTQVLINEAIINEEVFKVYGLTENDIKMVLEKEGQPVGNLPLDRDAKEEYLKSEIQDFKLDNIKNHIDSLSTQDFKTSFKENIISQLESMYQGNSNIEEFCIKHQVNPINVWYWFKESRTLPKPRMNDISMEFLADVLREVLMEDDDGIVPLVPNAGEKILYDRVHEKFIEKGFSQAQFSSFDSLLGKEINRYINEDFFKVFSNYIKLFKRLPMTPFIWHLSSGKEKGFEAFVIIYKWSRDNLLRLRSVYIENVERALVNKKIDLQDNNTAEAQNKKDIISKQLKEIDEFKTKIDELLEEGYDPQLDDGVGKNIAPLQKKKMISYDVLNAGQLKKYLNADW
ncbi:BREX-1 system adenine-specific DNA-methyltransferase PglX [Aliarcobacter butzleri]|uniref:site-specific DNA-methyltransferase (adenine-specific) n=1 Tax=Aliarcobacter butzleri L348 TaxID=1447256 RepID=A0A0G9K1F5_9BACT|nr:BREX-1 system adenine-specific DNA-methyltransferase PglX [Aliarcobacter butzleri]KLD98057.1 restriction endonuclease Eco57I [Aliarcobacter butzleri L348]